jgi:uncharacterized protein with PQ loop repeat
MRNRNKGVIYSKKKKRENLLMIHSTMIINLFTVLFFSSTMINDLTLSTRLSEVDFLSFIYQNKKKRKFNRNNWLFIRRKYFQLIPYTYPRNWQQEIMSTYFSAVFSLTIYIQIVSLIKNERAISYSVYMCVFCRENFLLFLLYSYSNNLVKIERERERERKKKGC